MSPDIIPAAAREANARASACIDERQFVASIVHAEAAALLCPDWPKPWWALTVGYKHARRWQDALHACDRAIALDPEDCEGPRWNEGIAATALALWPRARAAWASLGIAVPAGDGPIVMPLGPTPVRVSPADNPEVVWCDRIDPCRARIRSIPLPDSGRRYDDLVLHDGEARGYRRIGDQRAAVFDELEVLEESTFGTWEIVVHSDGPEALDALVSPLRHAALPVEDWTENLEALCEACSLGEPDHEHHAPAAVDADWAPERTLGVAAHSESQLAPLRRAHFWWRREVISVRQVL